MMVEGEESAWCYETSEMECAAATTENEVKKVALALALALALAVDETTLIKYEVIIK